GGYGWSDQAEEGPNYALMAFSSSSSDSEVSKSQNDQLLKDLKKSELTVLGNFMPPTPDLSFTGLDEFVNEPVVENCKAMSSEEEPKIVKKNDDAPIIEEWVSGDEEEDVSHPKSKKKIVRPISKSKDGKTCLEQFSKGESSKFAKKTHPYAKKNLVPRAVLTKSGLVSVNSARQVNAAYLKITVNVARPMSYLSKTAYSTVKRPIYKNTSFKNSNINQRVNTARDTNFNTARLKEVVNAVKGNIFNVVKASACWVWKPKHKVLDHGNPQMDLQDQGVIDSGCSRHMTGNMSYLTDYEEIDGGYITFGGNPKGGKIIGKEVKTASPPRNSKAYCLKIKMCVPCARYQVNPKVSHLHAVKKIFRLISCQCKKQTVVANSTIEAEYVAASSCCGQVLWIQNQLLDYGVWRDFGDDEQWWGFEFGGKQRYKRSVYNRGEGLGLWQKWPLNLNELIANLVLVVEMFVDLAV
ncbi:hypothetical protein Tco_0635733, partial [Tanacetum coccineum]